MSDNAGGAQVPVWDPMVRLGHWALVIGFAVAYLTGEEEGEPSIWHEWAGYIVGAIVVWRVVWGVVGTQHARFSDFAVWPRSALVYLIELVAGRSRRYLGHSPAGGVMVITLLAILTAIVVSGILADQDIGMSRGQMGVKVPEQTQAEETGKAARTAMGQERPGQESFSGEVHGALANVTLVLVILHVLGVALASFVHRENLVAAMITGKKRLE